MRYLIKACMLLAFSSVLMAQQSDIAKIDSAFFNSHARIITRQDLQRLPFRGESQDYYGLFPGTVQQDYRGTEFLHIRGSRHDEIAYSFEGVDVRSAFTGLNMIRFIPEALDRITLNMSPDASENSAVALLQHRLRRGRSDFRASVKTETDRFTSSYNERLRTFSYGYFNMLLTAEGKIFKENIRFFAAGERSSFSDHYRKFWDGFCIGGANFTLEDEFFTRQTLQEVVGTEELVVSPGNIPEAASLRYTVNGLITADYNPIKLRLVSAFNWNEEQQNETPIQHTFNPERIPEYKQKTGFVSLQADYFGRRDWRWHLQLDLLRSSEKTLDPVFEDNFLFYLDSLATIERGLNYIPGTNTFRIHGFPFSHPGALLATYSKSEENYWSFSGAVHKKLGSHKFKAGAAFQSRTLRRFAIGRHDDYIRALEFNRGQLLQIRNRGDVRTFGYDVFGNKADKAGGAHDAAKHPTKYSFYFEDQFAAQDVLLNMGLRYASFSSDANVFVDPNSPQLERSGGSNIPLTGFKSAASQQFILPRFRAQFNPNEQLKLHFQYGRYAQQVRLSDVYASRGYWKHFFDGGFFWNDPRGTAAEPVQATQTEFGISYERQPYLRLQTTLFYKNTDGHLETEKFEVDPASAAFDYNALINSGEAISKGIEFNINYKNKGLHSWINYTLSGVKGFTSYPITNLRDAEVSGFATEAFHSKAEPATALDFNQKHRGNVFISYVSSKGSKPFWRQTGLHLLFRFNSGHNFTLYEGGFG